MKLLKHVLAATSLALLAALLAACGGGGGGSSGPVSSTETFQVRTALTNYLTNTQTYNGTLSGTYSGHPVTGTFIVSQGSLSSTTFESTPALAKSTTVTGSVVVNGSTIPLASTTTSYFDTNYVPLGKTGGTDYEVVNSISVNIPVTSRVGDTGNLYTVNRYSSNLKTLLRGTTQASYALEPDTASTAILKLIMVEKDTFNTTTSISTVSYQITPSGSITRKQETLTESNAALVVTY